MSHFSLQQTEPQLNWFVERRDNSDLFDDLVEQELESRSQERRVSDAALEVQSADRIEDDDEDDYDMPGTRLLAPSTRCTPS
jgi:hypothetical protein